VHDDVGNGECQTIHIPRIGTFVGESETLWNSTISVVLDFYPVVREYTLEMKGEPACDAAFAEVILQ
jgi:hypothetical protein